MPENEGKTCRGCGRTLPLAAFWKQKRGRDGYNPRCKECLSPNPERVKAMREQAREWRRNNPKRHEANKRAYYARYPEKRAAKNAVYYALKRGTLARLPCEMCGNPQSQAHHDDYSRKLEVRWLCRAHHAQADMERSRSPAQTPPGSYVP